MMMKDFNGIESAVMHACGHDMHMTVWLVCLFFYLGRDINLWINLLINKPNRRDREVWELPPNGQGTAALQMLNILEAYDIAEMGFGSAEYIHYFTEAKKLAFEDRAKFYADPDFSDIPMDMLLSKEYAAEKRSLINDKRAGRSYPAGKIEKGNTIYMTVADKDGNMVSLIQSNYRGMGSGMCPPGLGFILQEAGDAPRIRHSAASQPTGGKMKDGGILYLESGIQWDLGGYGGYQAILWDEKNKVYYGASESRKDGQAAGY